MDSDSVRGIDRRRLVGCGVGGRRRGGGRRAAGMFPVQLAVAPLRVDGFDVRDEDVARIDEGSLRRISA